MARIAIAALVAILGAAGYFVFVKQSKPVVQQSTPTLADTAFTQSDLNRIFELDNKEPGTKLYYSDKLGIGFTYLPLSSGIDVSEKITEFEDKIEFTSRFYHHSIEVFPKDPKMSFEQAIEDRFLQGYSPTDCFVVTNTIRGLPNPNHISAEIYFPDTDNPEDPWWQNSEKCPPKYSAINAVRYFLMNENVPDKFIFVEIGQDTDFSDGTKPKAKEDGSDISIGYSWFDSIRILK